MPGKKFHFRLEAVRKLRYLEAERAKVELAEAVGRVVQAREALRASQEELDDLMTRAASGRAITDLRRFAQARSEAIDRAESLRFQARELEAAELQAKQALAARMRDHQALEDLRARQLEEFKNEANRVDQLALDEFGVIGYSRREAQSAAR